MWFFFFNDTATTEIYTLSLHDALPICVRRGNGAAAGAQERRGHCPAGKDEGKESRCGGLLHPSRPGLVRLDVGTLDARRDRKSTRLNSSHANISYAVFCLKKKKITNYV